MRTEHIMSNTLAAPRFALSENVARNGMSSLELLALVNEVRAEFGEPEVRHNDFVNRCRDELEGEFYETFVIKPDGPGRPSEAIGMTADQCKLVAMRESKGVRRRVLARLNELESKALPSYPEALRQLADKIDENARIAAERDHAIATKAQIGAKREATAMATASAAARKARQLEQELGRGTQHATIIAVENVTGRSFGKQAFQPLKRWCRLHDVHPPKVPCPRFGKAVSWPAQAWKEVYGVDLGKLFGEVLA